MKLRNIGVLAVLFVGNLLLWGDRFSPGADRRFEFAGFQKQVEEALPDSQLASLPFEANPFLPDEYVYLQASDQYYQRTLEEDAAPWFSVYVGYYPGRGLMGDEPHDPRVCYEVSLFSALQDEVMELRLPELQEPLFVKRLLVEHNTLPDANGESQTFQRIAYYWSHSMGNMPRDRPGGLAAVWHLPERLLNRRSDLVWVRVELLLPAPIDGRELPQQLDSETTRRLYRIMRAAAASML